MEAFKPVLSKIAHGESLTRAEAEAAFEACCRARRPTPRWAPS